MLTLNVMRKPIDQTWSIEKIATEAPPVTWENVFQDAKHELSDVSQILNEQERMYGTYYPLKKDIFAAFQYTPLNNVKVVIVGQDPYHQTISIHGQSVPRAVGLSFSVRREDSTPSSLQNIYTELANTVRGFTKPDHGDLREWARQGVLLLNMCLTVRPSQAGSHGDIWLGFNNKVFKAIAAVNPYCIFMLWGKEAQKVKPMLGERSTILEAAHPSGLSARKGFFGCNHFNLANDALIRQGKVGINWRISSLAELTGPVVNLVYGAQTAVIHKPILTPVNMDALPTIIPLQPQIARALPTIILGPPAVKVSPSVQGIPLLPTIPNIKDQNNGSHAPSEIRVATPPKPTNANEPTVVPVIPKIKFGTTVLNTNPIMAVGVPQIITTKPAPVIQTALPTIIGLPLILPII